MDDLAHDRMARVCSDVIRRRLDVALVWYCPLVVLGRQLGQGILIFCSGDDGLEGLGAILGLGGARDARNPSYVSLGTR